MGRRQALAVAGAATMLAGSAALAVGANFGLFGLARSPAGVGNYRPASAVSPAPTTSTTEQTEIVDVPVPEGQTSSTTEAPSPEPDKAGTGVTTTTVGPLGVTPTTVHHDDSGERSGTETTEVGSRDD